MNHTTEAPFSFDGHGINNAKGERLFTCARHHKDNGGGYVLYDGDHKRIGALLASAPDLLAALAAGLHHWHADGRNFHKTEPQWLAQARAAIAKATGQ